MSVSIILVPLAVSAVAIAQSKLAKGGVVCHVSTRMKDVDLLETAIVDTGALVTREENLVVAQWREVTANFTRTDDIWSAEFTGNVDEARALEIIRSVDASYGRQVQQAVLARIHERAEGARLTIESEQRNADASVTLVLNVGEVRS